MQEQIGSIEDLEMEIEDLELAELDVEMPGGCASTVGSALTFSTVGSCGGCASSYSTVACAS